MPLGRLGATTALALLLAAVMACGTQGATETSGAGPSQALTPATVPATETVTEPSIETLAPITGTPATGETAPSPVAATASPVPHRNLIWRLSSPDNGPFKAGEELSLTLDLDPRDLGVSGVQFRVNYPGELLHLREIVPGDILGPDPLVVDKIVDNADKPDPSQVQVLFAMARRGDAVAPTGPGRVALIKMVTRQEIPQNGNVMIWLDRVKLTGGDFQAIGQDSVFWSLSGPG